jgi:hypothetical protein
MNERIKQLMPGSWTFSTPEQGLYTQEQMEKFAELIVAECAALAKSKSEYIQSMETDDRGDQMQIQSLAWQFEEFGYKIKKHFGVEE